MRSSSELRWHPEYLRDSGKPVILVTGGTGIVGSALLPKLASAFPVHQIITLTRSPKQSHAHLFGDITQRGLGISPDVMRVLQVRTELLIHAAADTRFNQSLEGSRLANREGTRHVLDFAQACPRLEQFAHISTLYIAGRRAGAVTEVPLRHSEGYVNTYEQSRHEAEELVLDAGAKLPISVYRLSSVVDGCGNRGHVRQMIRLISWSDRFPIFPASPDVPVDLITAEWAARALVALIAHEFEPGAVRHVCAGSSSSLRFGQIVELACEVRRPRLVPLSECSAEEIQRVPEALMTFIPHLSIAQPFDSTVTARLLARHGIAPPDPRILLTGIFADQFRGAEVPA